MSEIEVPFPLEAGETRLEVIDLVEGQSLASDGNSRWQDFGDKRYFVVNADYKAPKN